MKSLSLFATILVLSLLVSSGCVTTKTTNGFQTNPPAKTNSTFPHDFNAKNNSNKNGLQKLIGSLTPGKKPKPLQMPPMPGDDAIRLDHQTEISPELYVVAGEMSLQKNALDKAEDYFKRAIKLDPKNLKANVGLARIAEARGQTQKSKKLYQAIRQWYPNTPLNTLLGSINAPLLNEQDLTPLEVSSSRLLASTSKKQTQALESVTDLKSAKVSLSDDDETAEMAEVSTVQGVAQASFGPAPLDVAPVSFAQHYSEESGQNASRATHLESSRNRKASSESVAAKPSSKSKSQSNAKTNPTPNATSTFLSPSIDYAIAGTNQKVANPFFQGPVNPDWNSGKIPVITRGPSFPSRSPSANPVTHKTSVPSSDTSEIQSVITTETPRPYGPEDLPVNQLNAMPPTKRLATPFTSLPGLPKHQIISQQPAISSDATQRIPDSKINENRVKMVTSQTRTSTPITPNVLDLKAAFRLMQESNAIKQKQNEGALRAIQREESNDKKSVPASEDARFQVSDQ